MVRYKTWREKNRSQNQPGPPSAEPVSWRIYYADGLTFDSGQGKPHESPDKGVCCVVSADSDMSRRNVGRMVLNKKDWYYHVDNEGWYGCDLVHMLTQMKFQAHKINAVREGFLMPCEEFSRISSIAMHDPDFPVKSARKSIEGPF